MKTLSSILFLVIIAACDPMNFGYKLNPAYVLNTAFVAIQNHDLESFIEVTGKETVCIYGNDKGLNYLKENITLRTEDISFKPKVLETIHYKNPVYVNFWSYYHERYQIHISEKSSKEIYLKAIVDCEFGIEGTKDPKYVNLDPRLYKRKQCSLVKIIPQTFSGLPVPAKCNDLRINL